MHRSFVAAAAATGDGAGAKPTGSAARAAFKANIPKARRTIPPEKAAELFPPEQRKMWPRGYLPTATAAFFLKRDAVTLREVIGAREDLRNDSAHDLQRDLAQDYQVWCRTAFEQFAHTSSDHDKSVFRRVMSRGSLPDYEDVVGVFDLPSLAAVNIEAESTLLPGVDEDPRAKEKILRRRAAIEQRRARFIQNRVRRMKGEALITEPLPPSTKDGIEPYPFTSYSQTLDAVLAPIQGCRSLNDPVRMVDLPTVRNLLHIHHDATSHLRFLSFRTGDDILPSQQLVTELATYLRERWEKLDDASKKKPILLLFGNGRLGAALNEAGILPVNVFTAAPYSPIQRQRQSGELKGQQTALDLPGPIRTPRTFAKTFPVETIGIAPALHKYKPALVIMEPHMERDYTAEARGYYSVREVLMMGRVDGPGMASFNYPWLSFGCAPSLETYWIVNEKLQLQEVPDDKSFMPTDAPYVAQGYDKVYIDRISKWLVGSNDTPRLPHQYRCVAFRRTEIPPDPTVTQAANNLGSDEPHTPEAATAAAKEAVADSGSDQPATKPVASVPQ
jgi:hypothetical protein